MNSVIFEYLDMYDINASNWQSYHPNGIYTSGASDVIVRYSKFHKGPKGYGCGEGIFFEQAEDAPIGRFMGMYFTTSTKRDKRPSR